MRYRYGLLALGLGAGASWGVGESAYELVQAGNALYNLGDYATADERYAKAAQLEPSMGEIDFNRGNGFFKRFIYEKALEHYSRAQETAAPALLAHIKFNLGNVKYQQAIAALMTFQDAATPIRAALDYYRDSLRHDPSFTDARYNLELAQRLMIDIRNQRVIQQNNPGLRDQKTSDNAGQQFEGEANQDAPAQPMPPPEGGEGQQRQGNSHQQSAPENASTEEGGQSQPTMMPEEVTPEDAEQFIQMARERAEAAEGKRQQWRRTQMKDAAVAKYW